MPAIDFLPYNVKRRQLFVKPYGYVAVSGGHSPFDWTTTRAKQPARAVSTDPIETYDTGSPYTGTAGAARARSYGTYNALAASAVCPPGCTPATCPGTCQSESSVISAGAGSGAAQTGQHTPTTITPATLTSRFKGINPNTAFTQNPSSSASAPSPATNQTVANLERWVRANPTAVIAVVVVGITLAIIGPRF